MWIRTVNGIETFLSAIFSKVYKRTSKMIDVLNYISSDGWEFVNSYVITIGNQNVYHWLCKKKN